MTIPKKIHKRLLQLATFPENHTLLELAEELFKLSLKCSEQSNGEFRYVVFYNPALLGIKKE